MQHSVSVHAAVHVMLLGLAEMALAWLEQSCASSSTPSAFVSAHVGCTVQHSVSVHAAAHEISPGVAEIALGLPEQS